MVVFPAPVGPTMAIRLPLCTSMVRSLSTFLAFGVSERDVLHMDVALRLFICVASSLSGSSGASSMRRNTRSAAATAACISLIMFAASRIGPENFREYSTTRRGDTLPSVSFPSDTTERRIR